jgi:gluconolactonase
MAASRTVSRSTRTAASSSPTTSKAVCCSIPGPAKVEPFLDRPHGERFKGLNDLIFAKNGDLYFTDQGESGLHDPTRLYRLRADGRLELLLDNVPSPNGLVRANEEILYLAVTRNNALWRVPLLPDGNLGRVGIFIQLSGGMGPDGMAMDADGNLAVCHVGMGSIWLFSRLGRPLAELQSCAGMGPTNAAYGGPERKTLYITESETGTILSAQLDVPGKELYSHM